MLGHSDDKTGVSGQKMVAPDFFYLGLTLQGHWSGYSDHYSDHLSIYHPWRCSVDKRHLGVEAVNLGSAM
jgi:hypothetical protein